MIQVVASCICVAGRRIVDQLRIGAGFAACSGWVEAFRSGLVSCLMRLRVFWYKPVDRFNLVLEKPVDRMALKK